MKTMKIMKLLGILIFLSIIAASCQKDQETNDKSALASGMKDGCQVEVNLIAGQFTDVGSVTAEINGTQLLVSYSIDELGWCMNLTHLDVQLDPDYFPQTKKGNPKIGHFAYGESLACATFWEQVIELGPLGYSPGDKVYIAAHAEVGTGGIEGFELALPDCANLFLTGQYPGASSYFQTATITLGGDLDGVYEGWCIDVGNGIGAYTNYTVNVYSSTEVLPDGYVDKPEFLPHINWILNQNWVGQTSTCNGEAYTFGDVQRAIWELIDFDQADPGEPWTQCKVDAIVNDALANADGYVPDCGDYIGVVLVPVLECGDTDKTNQVIIIPVPFECGGNETAWGEGPYQFSKKNGWAMYFDIECD